MDVGHRSSVLDVLDAPVRQELLRRAVVVRARKGQTLLARAEKSDDAFILQEGRLQAALYAANGREVSLRELDVGQMFGELSAIDGEARSVSIIARTDVRALRIRGESLREAILLSPTATAWMLSRLSAQVRHLTNRVFELSTLNVRTRLHCELIRLTREARNGRIVLEPAPTHMELANRIGTHREAVTRELNMLEEMGIIRSGRRRLEFVDVVRLQDMVLEAQSDASTDDGWW